MNNKADNNKLEEQVKEDYVALANLMLKEHADWYNNVSDQFEGYLKFLDIKSKILKKKNLSSEAIHSFTEELDSPWEKTSYFQKQKEAYTDAQKNFGILVRIEDVANEDLPENVCDEIVFARTKKNHYKKVIDDMQLHEDAFDDLKRAASEYKRLPPIEIPYLLFSSNVGASYVIKLVAPFSPDSVGLSELIKKHTDNAVKNYDDYISGPVSKFIAKHLDMSVKKCGTLAEYTFKPKNQNSMMELKKYNRLDIFKHALKESLGAIKNPKLEKADCIVKITDIEEGFYF